MFSRMLCAVEMVPLLFDLYAESCKSCKKVKTICFGTASLAPGFLKCRLCGACILEIFKINFGCLDLWFALFFFFFLLESDSLKSNVGVFLFVWDWREVWCWGVKYVVERAGEVLRLCGLIPNLDVTQSHLNMTHLKRGKARLCELSIVFAFLSAPVCIWFSPVWRVTAAQSMCSLSKSALMQTCMWRD